ncbi:MAG: hypothetical protein F6K11_21910 [Leptolyngbya sp. SIO3F4]|nr:hypothetical protein [Leptolyngbya sp. SIO3F4]
MYRPEDKPLLGMAAVDARLDRLRADTVVGVRLRAEPGVARIGCGRAECLERSRPEEVLYGMKLE